MIKNNIYKVLMIFIIISLFITGCSKNVKQNNDNDKHIVLGGTDFSEPILELIQNNLEKQGYDVNIMLFDGNQIPATACMDGDVDGIIQNHKPWMEIFNVENDSNLVMLEPYIFYARTALYSNHYNKLEDLPNGAKIAIPGDPTNMELTLLLLQDIGLIKLGEKMGEFYNLIDVVENYKNIEIIETEISQTIRSIEDVDAVVTGAKSAVDYGMKADDFLVENKWKADFPAGIIIDKESMDKEWVKHAIDFIETQEFKDAFNKIYKGTLVLY